MAASIRVGEDKGLAEAASKGQVDFATVMAVGELIADQAGLPKEDGYRVSKDEAILIASRPTIGLRTPKHDKRFPNVNQAGNCWAAVNEYQRCVGSHGFHDRACMQRRFDFITLCPSSWLDEMQEQMDDGVFTGVANFLGPPEEEGEEEAGEEEEEE